MPLIIELFFSITHWIVVWLLRRDPECWRLKYLIAEKELQVRGRIMAQHGLVLRFTRPDRFFFASFRSVLNHVSSALTIVKPKTVMAWYHDFLKLRWTHPSGPRGRRPITRTIKDLILAIKKSNLFFGLTKIQGELAKSTSIWGVPPSSEFCTSTDATATCFPWEPGVPF